jgi:3-dehydroquinate synthase
LVYPQTIVLKLPASDQASPIWIGRGALSSLAELADLQKYSKVVIVGDSGAEAIISALAERIDCSKSRKLIIPGGEICKSIENLTELWGFFTDNKLDRKSLVIGVGGGALTDLAGFAAATYMRGIAFIPVPSTLLAQVDAGIGGKSGINFGGVKNLIGAIAQPVGILIDVDTLNELPARDLRSGFAEIVKHGLIADQEYFKTVTSRAYSDWGRDELAEIVHRSCEIKVAAVENDPYELGSRRALNFGHTLGHAIESCSHRTTSPTTHGEAVAIGMVAACFISVRMGLISSVQEKLCVEGIARAGLPTKLPCYLEPVELIEAMTLDKKSVSGVSRWTLLTDIGAAVVDQEVPATIVLDAISLVQAK